MFIYDKQHKPNESQVLSENIVSLDNGYKIAIRKEKISKVRRSIFRGIDEEQIVLSIVDQNGKVTNRLGIPAKISGQIAAIINL